MIIFRRNCHQFIIDVNTLFNGKIFKKLFDWLTDRRSIVGWFPCCRSARLPAAIRRPWKQLRRTTNKPWRRPKGPTTDCNSFHFACQSLDQVLRRQQFISAGHSKTPSVLFHSAKCKRFAGYLILPAQSAETSVFHSFPTGTALSDSDVSSRPRVRYRARSPTDNSRPPSTNFVLFYFSSFLAW